jgi:hypothetical protein
MGHPADGRAPDGYGLGLRDPSTAHERPLDADASLRVCDFFEIAKNRCGKQNRYGDKTVENSKKSQTCRMTKVVAALLRRF